jgi:hypothetical protein
MVRDVYTSDDSREREWELICNGISCLIYLDLWHRERVQRNFIQNEAWVGPTYYLYIHVQMNWNNYAYMKLFMNKVQNKAYIFSNIMQ